MENMVQRSVDMERYYLILFILGMCFVFWIFFCKFAS